MSSAPVFWFTGLSGSGETTFADAAKERLEEQGYSVPVLDGDDMRNRLHGHLDFNEEDNKGLYAKAGRGEMDNMIGISPSTPYQLPTNPDLVIDTAAQSPVSAIDRLQAFVNDKLARKTTA